MFRFANPQYLWLLLAIPALVLIFWQRHAAARLARFGNPGVLEELMPEVSTGRTALKFILFCTAAVLLILAVARPQFGSKLREEKAQGVEMMLVVDVSNSMLAEDFEPNRLERTKYAINKLFDGLRQDRVADRLRGRTEGTAAHHVGLPYGEGLRQAHRPVAGVGTGHGHRQGAVTGAAVVLVETEDTAGSSSW